MPVTPTFHVPPWDAVQRRFAAVPCATVTGFVTVASVPTVRSPVTVSAPPDVTIAVLPPCLIEKTQGVVLAVSLGMTVHEPSCLTGRPLPTDTAWRTLAPGDAVTV